MSDAQRHCIRVRYCETDRMGVAHHGAYVDWFEEARTEWMRARGSSYRELEDRGVLLPVVEVSVRYRQGVTYDDEIVVETRMTKRRRASVEFGYRVMRADDGSLVAEGTTTLACTDVQGRLQRLPDAI